MRYLAVLLLAGCATANIDAHRPPPSDWPALREQVVKASREEVRQRCIGASRTSYEPAGCALVYFSKGECIILDAGVDMDHERMHCRGYDHPGDSSFRDAWERYKARAAR